MFFLLNRHIVDCLRTATRPPRMVLRARLGKMLFSPQTCPILALSWTAYMAIRRESQRYLLFETMS